MEGRWVEWGLVGHFDGSLWGISMGLYEDVDIIQTIGTYNTCPFVHSSIH